MIIDVHCGCNQTQATSNLSYMYHLRAVANLEKPGGAQSLRKTWSWKMNIEFHSRFTFLGKTGGVRPPAPVGATILHLKFLMS